MTTLNWALIDPTSAPANGDTLGYNSTSKLWKPQPAVEVHATANKNHSTGTWTSADFDTEDSDTSGFFTGGAPTRLTVPSGLGGRYACFFCASNEQNATGMRAIRIYKNGTTGLVHMTTVAVTGVFPHLSVAFSVVLAAGDYLEGQLYQNSGSTLVIDASTGVGNCDQQARFSMVRTGS